MNSREGGTLLIGVADDGTIHGLDSDYSTRSKKDQDSRDWFHQHLAHHLNFHGDAAATYVRPQVHHVDGHDLCRLQVNPSSFPVEATVFIQRPDGSKTTNTNFYVPVVNGSKALSAVERDKHVARRWT